MNNDLISREALKKGNTRLSEKQVFNSKGFCSNFKNKNSKGGKENG